MRYLTFFLLILLGASLSACKPSDERATPTVALTPTPASASAPSFETEGIVQFSRSGLNIELPRPAGWESFNTDYGVVVAEKFGTVANQGELHGLMAYVFVTPLSEFPFPINLSGSANRAEQVLSGIIADPNSIGGAKVSTVTGFRWAESDAAYYLFTDPNTRFRTLVIGLSLPESGVILTAAISAPQHMADRIREVTPLLLSGLSLNAQAIDATGLQILPDTLLFPE